MKDKRKEFSQIYDKYINKIYRFVYLKVSSEEIAQDLCSETFLKGWESFKSNQVIDNPQAFLYRIAHNLVVDHYRTKSRTKVVSPEFLPVADPSPSLEEKSFFNSDLNQVKVALANIKEDYQNAIIWRYLDDRPISEVAKMMNKTEETTRVTLSRALKALRSEIEHHTA